MRVQGTASPSDIVGLGLVFGIAGLYFILGAAGMLPMPQINSPSFIIGLAGAAFLFAGGTCVVQARHGLIIERPAGDSTASPRWLVHRSFAIGGAGALAAIGTWLAISAGPRTFNLAMPLAEMPTIGDQIGRAVFALAATIAWIYVIALTIGTVRMFLDRTSGRLN
jgi:hypothetical protein